MSREVAKAAKTEKLVRLRFLRVLRGTLSSSLLPRIEEDRPFDDLGGGENAAMPPRIVSQQLQRLRLAARLHDEQRPAVIRVRTAQNDPPLFKDAINERRVLVPERLLARRQPRHPRRTGILKHEIKRGAHVTSPLFATDLCLA